MKKSLKFSFFVVLFVLCIGAFLLLPQGVSVSNASADLEFYQQLAEMETLDYGFVYVDKNEELSSFSKKLSLTTMDTKGISKLSHLSFNSLSQICNNNDYIINDLGDKYEIRNKYSLQTLIVKGDIENNYGASQIATGFLDYSILRYDSIESTKWAYQQFLADGVEVVLDSVIESEDFESENIDLELQENHEYENYYTWGAEEMDLNVYNDYLHNTSNEIVVAVLDSGICTSHPMFEGRLLTDGAGKYVGYSYVYSTYSYSGYTFEDDFGHGTHVAGIICDLTPSNVKILPIKVMGSNGKGSLTNIFGAVSLLESDSLKDYQIACANLSLGAIVSSGNEEHYIEYVDEIFQSLKDSKNALAVVSAGNKAKDTYNFTPASSDVAIVVSALKQSTDSNEEIIDGQYEFDSKYSNYGSSVDICAPGTNIHSAYFNPYEDASSSYGKTMSGTSMASPHVSAAVALLCLDGYYYSSESPDFTADEIEARLFKAAIDYGESGEDDFYGKGVLNLENHQSFFSVDVNNFETTYDGEYHNISVSVSNTTDYSIVYGLSEDNYDIEDITSNEKFKNFTNGEMTVYFKISKYGYRDATGSATLKINKQPLVVSVSNQSCIYGNIQLNQNLYAITSGQIFTNDIQDFSLKTSATNTSNADEYDINFVCTNQNYDISYTKGILSVSPRPITIKVQQTGVYGNSVSLNNNQYTIISGNVVNNDNLNIRFKTDATASSNVGTYAIKLDSFNTNYDINLNKAEYKITPKTLNIRLQNQTSEYGNAILNQNAYTLTSALATCDANKDISITLTTTASLNSEVGTYYISASCSNPNYTFKPVSAIHQIIPRKLTIKLLDQSTPYSLNPKCDQTAYKIVAGSIVGDDNLNLIITSNSNIFCLDGSFDITATYTNKNYDVDIISAKLRVNFSFISLTIVVCPLIVLSLGIFALWLKLKRRKFKKFYEE